MKLPHLHSYYAPPKATLVQYEKILENLVLNTRNPRPEIIADDSNTWVVDWESQTMNSWSQILLKTFVELNILLAKEGVITFRGIELGSIINRHVSESYSHIDFQSTFLDIRSGEGGSRMRNRSGKTWTVGWSIGAFEQEIFLTALEGSHDAKGTVSEKVRQL